MRALGGVVCFFWLGLFALKSIADDEVEYKFDIPAQSLDKSLNALSNQTESLILFPYDLVENRNATAVIGYFTIAAALDEMLIDTGLVGGRSKKGVLMISEGNSETARNRLAEKSMNKKKSVIAAIASIFISSGANAQTDSNKTSMLLEEIVITARKREESLMEIPLSVAVVDREFIEAASLNNLEDLANATPGFKLNNAFGRQGDRPVVRGVSGISTGVELAGYFVDGVYVSGTLSSYDLDSIERVEVLKGPQSATFGRRTFAGAINYVTQLPSEETEFRVKADVGSNAHRVLSVTASGTSGIVGYRANLRNYSYDGDFFNNQAAGPEDVGGEESNSFNGTLYITPSDDTSVRINFVYAEDDDEQYAIGLQPSSANNCSGVDLINRTRPYFCGEVDGTTPISLGGVFAPDQYGVQQDRLRANIQIDHDFGNLQLSSITAYNKDEYSARQDQTFAGLTQEFSFAAFSALPSPTDGSGFHTIGRSETENYSQELWLRGQASENLDWSAGLYYFDEEVTDLIDTDTDKVENIALMGTLDYTISDSFNAGFEFRYAEDDIEQTTGGGTQTFTETFDSFTYRLTGSWFARDGLMVYGNISTGTLPGQFNTNNALPANLIPVDEGKLQQIELGIKHTVNDRFDYTAAIYTQEWKDQIRSQFIIIDGTPESYQANQGTTDFLGLELSANWRPTDNLKLTGSVSLNDSEVNDFISDDRTDQALSPNGDGDVSGAQAPLSPDAEAYASATYDFAVGNDYNLSARLDWSYQASRYARLVNQAETGAASIVNARLTLTPPDSDWSLSLWGKNLTDEDSPTSILRYIEADSFFFGGRAFAFTPRRGTEVGITGTFEF